MSRRGPSTEDRPARMSVSQGSAGGRGEERVEVRRYLDALSRSRWLIGGIVAGVTGIVLLLSLLLPNSYQATSRLVFETAASLFGETDATSTQRQLATTETLLTSTQVLDRAARRVPGIESGEELEDKVTSSVEQQANIINITASDGDAERAAQIANAVGTAFLSERERLDREQIASARAQLEQEIIRLEGSPNAGDQIVAIRERISQLAVSEASLGSDLAIAERAEAPSAPASPRPLRNAVLAFFGALFLGVFIALGRDQLTPRVSNVRELGRLLDLPVLMSIPFVGGRGGRRSMLSGVELEAYQTLRSTIELSMPGDRSPHLLLITGAVHAEGKTTATGRLGHALAQAGHKVLLVSADLRVPRLHEMFNLELGIGMSDILGKLAWDQTRLDNRQLRQATHVVMAQAQGRGPRGQLHVITSGSKAKDPGRLVSGPAMQAFLEKMRASNYAYILIDAPPMLGIADSQAMARYVDEIVLVNRLERMTLEHVSELRDVVDRLPLRPMGIVVIGARGEISPYYLQRRPSLYEEDEAKATS